MSDDERVSVPAGTSGAAVSLPPAVGGRGPHPAAARPEALLVLADGTVFEGEAIGDPRAALRSGELVFNTAMSGYQEILTDPSYAGQVIAFTYPHIGNYGVAPGDGESRRPFCRGLVLRDLPPRPSSWRASEDLESFLARHGVAGIAGVDTRRLTRHVRDAGSIPCAFGTAGEAALLAAARAEPGTDGADLVGEVSAGAPYRVAGGPWSVVAYDLGIKSTILSNLSRLADVLVVPARTPAEEVLALEPDGVFLSNGPGDPAALGWLRESVAELLGEVPVFGICLGHQVLAAALGATTFKLPFGHHGANHPVRRLSTGTVEITSQNHNYAVREAPPGCEVTHVNLNDGVIEGLACLDMPAFSVQYHPEAAPGPHDARYLFGEFDSLMQRAGRRPRAGAAAGS
ncbi:MAG TPA: glutamine-hydrolyzing carbamoyl-phosphate synthase small subunit [Acidimicrobiales bacterium]|nr:glutamine-hydrolyzing carbamoyl-phosphate synthase small subunit [Acidimicrobiales bacterium]